MGDDYSPSQEGSRKRAAEESPLGERKSPNERLTNGEQDQILRSRLSMANPSDLGRLHGFPNLLAATEPNRMDLEQLQRMRTLQMLAAARDSQQPPIQQPSSLATGQQYRDRIADEVSGQSLEQQLNLYRAAAAAAAARSGTASSNILRDEGSSIYPRFQPSDEFSRLSARFGSGRTTASAAVSDYMDLLDQLRQQEQLNEQLIQEAQLRQQQLRRYHQQEQGGASIPEGGSARAPPPTATTLPTHVPRSNSAPRPKAKRPPQGESLEASPTYKPGIPLELPTDKDKLTTYQTLIRASLEYFKATQDDINTTVQGRRQKLQSGQNQAAQNIAAAHLSKPCAFMPETIQEQMETERHKKGASKAGQNYWVKACDELGFVERDGGLWQADDADEQKGDAQKEDDDDHDDKGKASDKEERRKSSPKLET